MAGGGAAQVSEWPAITGQSAMFPLDQEVAPKGRPDRMTGDLKRKAVGGRGLQREVAQVAGGF